MDENQDSFLLAGTLALSQPRAVVEQFLTGEVTDFFPLLVPNHTHPPCPNPNSDPHLQFPNLGGSLSPHVQDDPEKVLEGKKATQLWSPVASGDVCSLFGPSTILFPPTFHSGLSLGPTLSLTHLLGFGPSMIKFLPILILFL